MTTYAFHPDALRDLDEIWEYIAADNSDAADRILDNILRKCESLAILPHQGHRRSELTSAPLRFVVVRDYVLAYAPDEQPVWIVAVLHGRRHPRVLAAMLRDRTSSTP